MSIPNRDQQHGGMEAVGQLSQNLKGILRAGDNWHRLLPSEREALDMIAHKISRILSGANPHDTEHWEDVAGYAQAAMRGGTYDPANGTGGVLLQNPAWAGGGE